MVNVSIRIVRGGVENFVAEVRFDGDSGFTYLTSAPNAWDFRRRLAGEMEDLRDCNITMDDATNVLAA